MGKQHNRRIFAGFYKRYDNKYIYVVAVVPDADTEEKVLICHEGLYADKDIFIREIISNGMDAIFLLQETYLPDQSEYFPFRFP